ncbi:MAG: hypothetical protein ACKN9V_06735 [Pseudomonadota bacterium]
MNRRKIHILFLTILICRITSAAKLSSLPGGLLFPAFSNASLVNSAAMSLDWRQEAKVLYSPSLNQDQPHGYLVGLGYSNAILGMNLGYLGSYQDSSTYDSIFSGISFRMSRLSIGTSFRKVQLESGNPIQTDVSAVLILSPITRMGAVVYQLGDEPQIGAGIGFGRLGKQTLSADVLFPAKPKGKGMVDQYAANLSFTDNRESFAYSLGMRFSRQQDGFSNESQISGNVGAAFPISKSVNVTSLYHSNPHTITFGFVWLWTPPAEQYIQMYKSENLNTIWNTKR